MLDNSSHTPNAAVASLFAIVIFGFWLSVGPSLTPARGAASVSAAAATINLR